MPLLAVGGVLAAAVGGLAALLLTGGNSTDSQEPLSPQDLPAGVIATVAEAPTGTGTITEAEFDRALAQTAGQANVEKVPSPGDARYAEMKESALNNLLEFIWLEGLAEEMGISVTERMVQKELAKLKDESFQNATEYSDFLTEAHFSQADVHRQVKLQVLSTQIQEALTARVRDPSQDEIRRYYEKNRATQFMNPASGGEPAHAEPLSTVRPQIRSQLIQEAEQEEFTAFVEDFSEKWRSRTICAPSFATERCANGKERTQTGKSVDGLPPVPDGPG